MTTAKPSPASSSSSRAAFPGKCRPRIWNAVQFGDDLLAPVAGLARGRGVARAARTAAVPVEWRRPCGLVAGCCGQRRHTGGGWRGKNRLQSHGPTGASLAASIMCLPMPRLGDAFGGNLDRGQPPRCDVTQLRPLVDAVPPVRGSAGTAAASAGAAHSSGLGLYQWVVERTLGWLIASVPPAAGALRAAFRVIAAASWHWPTLRQPAAVPAARFPAAGQTPETAVLPQLPPPPSSRCRQSSPAPGHPVP